MGFTGLQYSLWSVPHARQFSKPKNVQIRYSGQSLQEENFLKSLLHMGSNMTSVFCL